MNWGFIGTCVAVGAILPWAAIESLKGMVLKAWRRRARKLVSRVTSELDGVPDGMTAQLEAYAEQLDRPTWWIDALKLACIALGALLCLPLAPIFAQPAYMALMAGAIAGALSTYLMHRALEWIAEFIKGKLGLRKAGS